MDCRTWSRSSFLAINWDSPAASPSSNPISSDSSASHARVNLDKWSMYPSKRNPNLQKLKTSSPGCGKGRSSDQRFTQFMGSPGHAAWLGKKRYLWSDIMHGKDNTDWRLMTLELHRTTREIRWEFKGHRWRKSFIFIYRRHWLFIEWHEIYVLLQLLVYYPRVLLLVYCYYWFKNMKASYVIHVCTTMY